MNKNINIYQPILIFFKNQLQLTLLTQYFFLLSMTPLDLYLQAPNRIIIHLLINDMNQKTYEKVNGCSQSPSLPQIASAFVFIIAIVLHSVLITTILDIQSPIILFIFALHYIVLAAVIIDYIILTLSDPVDSRLLESKESLTKQETTKELVYCQNCKTKVHMYSYHCRKCKRCVEQFDHHCVFLNNCIGRKNYSNFFRLLLTLTIFLLLNIGQGVWLFVTNESAYRWVALTLVIYCCIIIPQIVILAVFHCYISFFLYKTTLEVIRGDLKADQIAYIAQSTPHKKLSLKIESSSIQTENNITTETELHQKNIIKMESV